MNCPACNRNWAATLSVCPACGSMTNDTVREELQTKITTMAAPRFEAKSTSVLERPPEPEHFPMTRPVVAQPVARRTETAGLAPPKTSPTLVGFQSKNASLPEWRLQLQNAVQQRKGGHVSVAESNAHCATNGATALKVEVVPRREPATEPKISDPRVASAMRRIEESRKAFLEPDAPLKKTAQPRPFGVVSPNGNSSTTGTPTPFTAPPKPRLVMPTPVADRDTNKLPPIQAFQPLPVIGEVKIANADPSTEFAGIKRIRIRAENAEITSEITDMQTDEIEDLAPLSMRFSAGLFDLIIGAFASLLLLSPVVFTGGEWLNTTGMLTLAGTFALFSLVYMTVCLGFFGKTLGMRLFSLELVDAVENEYPTLQQAAISSSIFIISLPLAGAGFLTVFFNEERRAIHDLLSGTIIVREF